MSASETSSGEKPKKKRSAKGKSASGSSSRKVPQDVATKKGRKVVYDSLDVFIYEKDHAQSEGPLNVETAKQYLGWAEETENVKFKNDYLFKDRDGNKVRCHNNVTNRPFDPNLAQQWMHEILAGHWKMNGETIIIDKLALIHNGQHRLIGLVWAEQERKKNPKKYPAWKGPVWMPSIFVVGVEYDDATINTIDTGKPRTMSDVIYRCPFFEDMVSRERKKAAKICEFSVKTLWWRTGAKDRSFSPRASHADSLQFIEQHPTILDCVKFVWEENGGAERKLERWISLGMASGLLYLMMTSATDEGEYNDNPTEESVDFANREKAEQFIVELASGSSLKVLTDYLQQQSEAWREVGPGIVRHVVFGSLIKAWNLYSKGKKLTTKGIQITVEEDDMGVYKVLEHPYCGGVDQAV